MVEQAAELVVQRLQVGLGERLALIIFHGAHLVLPVDHILGGDLCQLPLAEVGQDLLLNDALLGFPGVQFDLGLDVLLVQLCKALEAHVHICLLFHQEGALPCQGFPLGGKAALELLLPLAPPVGVAELYIPGAVFLVLECSHSQTSFSVRVP